MGSNGNGSAMVLTDEVVPTRSTRDLGGLDMVPDLASVLNLATVLGDAAGFLPAWIKTKGQAVAVLLAGRELGIPPMRAFRVLHMIEGKVELAATEMLALLMRGGVKVQWVRSDADVAHLRLERTGHAPHEEIYTMEDAKRAELAGKGNWKKHPKAMLRARCISGAARAYAPDLLGNVYVEGEIADEVRPAGSTGSADVVDLGAALHETDAAPAGPDPLAHVMFSLSQCKTPGDLAEWLRAHSAAVETESDNERKRDRWKTIGKTAGGLVPPVRKAELLEMFRVARQNRAPAERDPADELASVETAEMLRAWAGDHLAWLKTLPGGHPVWSDIAETAKRIDAPNAAIEIDALVSGEVA